MKPPSLQFRQEFEEAIRLHQGGRRAEALSRYRQLRVQQPFLPPLLNLLGLALVQEGEVDAGAALIRDATRRAPGFADAWLNLAFAERELGNRAAAEAAYRQALRMDGKNLSAALSLASLLSEAGNPEAMTWARRATLLAPRKALPWLRLRRACLQHADAAGVEVAERQLESLPLETPEELVDAALIRLDQRRFEEASALCQEALRRRPDYALAALTLGDVTRNMGDPATAIQHFRRAAQLAPRRPEPWIGIGFCRVFLADKEGAAHAFSSAIDRDPQNVLASHMLDSVHGRQSSRVPADFVRQTFNEFAKTFDAVLQKDLRYRAPDLIADALNQAYPERRFATLLDIGCGTGLVARALAGRFDTAIGVDLSPGMLVQAAATKLYAELVEADVITFLESRRDRFDLVVAADILVYLGDLNPLFGAVAHCLPPGGCFAMTTERLDPAAGERGPYGLRPTGRYAHDDAYLLALATNHGLALRRTSVIDLRQEREHLITGSLVLVERSPA